MQTILNTSDLLSLAAVLCVCVFCVFSPRIRLLAASGVLHEISSHHLRAHTCTQIRPKTHSAANGDSAARFKAIGLPIGRSKVIDGALCGRPVYIILAAIE